MFATDADYSAAEGVFLKGLIFHSSLQYFGQLLECKWLRSNHLLGNQEAGPALGLVDRVLGIRHWVGERLVGSRLPSSVSSRGEKHTFGTDGRRPTTVVLPDPRTKTIAEIDFHGRIVGLLLQKPPGFRHSASNGQRRASTVWHSEAGTLQCINPFLGLCYSNYRLTKL